MKKKRLFKPLVFSAASFLVLGTALFAHGGEVKAVHATGTTVDLSTLTGDYVAQDGDTLTGTLGGHYKISVDDGAIVTLNNCIINGVNNYAYQWSGLTCEGDATINLVGENTLRGFDYYYGGISVPAYKTLTINGPGSLLAGSSSDNGSGAGIGSPDGETCGNIIINGATIEASSGYGSGIGGGESGSCGDITIIGSTINAHGEYGSGIGPGKHGSSGRSTGGNITITNSEITASCDSYAAVIGASQNSSIGDITLTNSDITIVGESYETPIGANSNGTCGDITINGGTLNITAAWNTAAIGSGSAATCGDITILDGNITATGGDYSPAIGAGTSSLCGNITISGGTVNAYGGIGASAIGAGQRTGAACEDILINGGTVTATALSNSSCPGIGTSRYESSVGNITVTSTVSLLTVTRGDSCVQTIGKSNYASTNSCGTVTIGSKAYYPTNNPFVFPVPHEHSWSYAADGASITATCGNEDCPVTTGLTLTLQAPDNLVYDGTNKVCSFASGYSEAAFGTPSIEYYEDDSLVSECVNTGTYEAKVTVGGVTASLEFEISQADPTGYDVPTGLASTYGNKLSSVTLPSGWTWKNPNDLVGNAGDRTHVAIYTPEDPNYHSVEENVTIAVAKANPTYVVPSGLRIKANSTLSMLSLPTGFTWVDPTQNVGSIAGDFTFKADYTPSDTDNYNVVNNIDIPVEVYVHEHNWSYVANGSSISASCSNPDCPVTTGLTLTLVAPTSLVFDGSVKTASIEAGYSSEAFGTPSISYFKNGSSVASCIDAGAYEARVTVGGATAKLQFEISQADPTGYDIPTGLEAVYGDKLSSVTLPEHWSWKNPNDLVGNVGNQTHIAIYTPENPNYKAVEENVIITVKKANPTYVVPSTIDAPYNVDLSTIGLPEGFSWMDGSQKTSTWGENTFKAKYTPSDTVNYNIVENIDIKVNVKWIIVDPTEGDVTVTINDGETEYNVDISVKVEVKTEITTEQKRTNYANVGRDFVKPDEDIKAIYNVKLIRTIDGVEQEIQPSDIKEGTKITVSMPIPTELIGNDFRLLHIMNSDSIAEIENYAVTKDGKTLMVEIDKVGEFAFIGHTDKPNGFDYSTGLPGWAIALIIVGSILLLCCLCYVLLFFVFNKWIRKDDKAIRAVKFGKKDNKVRLLVMPFRLEYREEAEVFDTKQEALKE